MRFRRKGGGVLEEDFQLIDGDELEEAGGEVADLKRAAAGGGKTLPFHQGANGRGFAFAEVGGVYDWSVASAGDFFATPPNRRF